MEWLVLTWPIRAGLTWANLLSSHNVQSTPSVRMAAHLNQNNGALRHSWWDILIYVIGADPSSGSLFSDEEAQDPACRCPLYSRLNRHANLFVLLSAVTLIHRRKAPDGAEEVELCFKKGPQSKINWNTILNRFSFTKISQQNKPFIFSKCGYTWFVLKVILGGCSDINIFSQVSAGLMPLTL